MVPTELAGRRERQEERKFLEKRRDLEAYWLAGKFRLW